MFKKKEHIVTHDGAFHADDVFATAALSMWLEKNDKAYKITRSRDESVIDQADHVLDVGGQYDPEQHRYDHHQRGGAGTHDSGISYASFGLIWKHFGLDLCEGDEDAWRAVEAKLVEPIDAIDTGHELVKEYIFEDRHPYSIHSFFSTFRPTWKEDFSPDIGFFKLLSIARIIIEREIVISKHWTEAYHLISDQLLSAPGEIGIVTVPFGRQLIVDVAAKNPSLDLTYIIYPTEDGKWHVVTTREEIGSFKSKLLLPESWRGLPQNTLRETTGVPDAIFCHPAGFLCGAESREGAQQLAQMALSPDHGVATQ